MCDVTVLKGEIISIQRLFHCVSNFAFEEKKIFSCFYLVRKQRTSIDCVLIDLEAIDPAKVFEFVIRSETRERRQEQTSFFCFLSERFSLRILLNFL